MNLPKDVEAKILATPGVVIQGAATASKAPEGPLTEKQWDACFRAAFKARRWVGYHTFNSRRSASGYPDWTLVRERILWVELKTDTGRLTAAQECWRDWIREGGGEWWCLRPRDWPLLLEVLQ